MVHEGELSIRLNESFQALLTLFYVVAPNKPDNNSHDKLSNEESPPPLSRHAL